MSITEISDGDAKLNTFCIRNIPLDKSFNPKQVEEALDYIPENGDIFICSYPKTGTTWMQYIVWKILYRTKALPSLDDMLSQHIPFMEATGTQFFKSLPLPRVYKHHLPYNLININEKAKYIYTYRNPVDTVVSYFYFLKNIGNLSADFDYFFESFLEGKLSHGDFFDHVSHYYQHRDDAHLLLVSYEDLQRNKKEQVLKVAKFLGENYYQDLMKDEVFLQEILTETEFGYMKQNIDTTRSSFRTDGKQETLRLAQFRKGIIGDGKNFLTLEQRNKLRCKTLEKIKDTELINFWSL